MTAYRPVLGCKLKQIASLAGRSFIYVVACVCSRCQVLRRSLSNIKDCSTAGSDSNGPTEFTSTHRVQPVIGSSGETVRRPSAATAVSVASQYTPSAGRPRVTRRPLTDAVPERPTTSRTVVEGTPGRPQRRSCSLDSKRSSIRQYQGLSASVLLAESTGNFYLFITSARWCCDRAYLLVR